MVTVTQIRELCDSLKLNDPRINEIVIVAHEGHMINKLKDHRGIILGCVYPSANRTGQPNEGMNQNTTWLFFLEKDVVGQPDAQEEAQFEKLQQVTIKALTYVEETAVSGCSYLSRHEPNGTQIIPEWNEFGGYNGWSMSLVF